MWENLPAVLGVPIGPQNLCYLPDHFFRGPFTPTTDTPSLPRNLPHEFWQCPNASQRVNTDYRTDEMKVEKMKFWRYSPCYIPRYFRCTIAATFPCQTALVSMIQYAATRQPPDALMLIGKYSDTLGLRWRSSNFPLCDSIVTVEPPS